MTFLYCFSHVVILLNFLSKGNLNNRYSDMKFPFEDEKMESYLF